MALSWLQKLYTPNVCSFGHIETLKLTTKFSQPGSETRLNMVPSNLAQEWSLICTEHGPQNEALDWHVLLAQLTQFCG